MGTSPLYVRKNPGNDRSEDRCKSIPLTHRSAKCYLKLSVVSLVLFYPKGDIRKISKTKLLKEVEITESSKLPFSGYQHASATVIDFMATIQPTDFSNFERFSNVANGITFKIISSFQKSDLLVIVPDLTMLNYQFLQKDYAVRQIQFKKLKQLVTVNGQNYFKVISAMLAIKQTC